MAFVERCSQVVADILRGAVRGRTPPEIAGELRRSIGIPEADYQYALLTFAHLRWLHARGLAEPEPAGEPRWRWRG